MESLLERGKQLSLTHANLTVADSQKKLSDKVLPVSPSPPVSLAFLAFCSGCCINLDLINLHLGVRI